jgi:transposase-like protein
MSAHKIERRDIAQMVHVPIETVHRWLLPMEAHGREDIPDMAIELLTLKLSARGKPPAA